MTRPALTKARRKTIISLIAQGTPQGQIAGIMSCSKETVRDVEKINHDSIEVRRKQLAGRLHVIVGPVLDRLERQVLNDELPTSTKDLAITSGILLDKYEKMTGQPTQIIRVEEADPGREEYAKWCKMKEINAVD